MQGVYLVINRHDGQTHQCNFPYDADAGRLHLCRLQQDDPPTADLVPPEPIPNIAPADRRLAYHLLCRAMFAMLNDRMSRAVPYLMAFSVLATVRYACITVMPDNHGLDINLTVLDPADVTDLQNIYGKLLNFTASSH